MSVWGRYRMIMGEQWDGRRVVLQRFCWSWWKRRSKTGRVGDKRSRYSAAIICCGSSLEAQICTGVVWCLARDRIAPQARIPGFPRMDIGQCSLRAVVF
jgi:hypothetical protein